MYEDTKEQSWCGRASPDKFDHRSQFRYSQQLSQNETFQMKHEAAMFQKHQSFSCGNSSRYVQSHTSSGGYNHGVSEGVLQDAGSPASIYSLNAAVSCLDYNESNRPLRLQSSYVPYTGTIGYHTDFQSKLNIPYLNAQMQQVHNQEESDQLFLKQWLTQKYQSCMQNTNAVNCQKTIKINEAQNLFRRCLSLNNELKEECDDLFENVECVDWNSRLAKLEKRKEEMISVQNVLSDPFIISDLQNKLHKRKQKRLWLKNRGRRLYFEKQEKEEWKKTLHEKIDEWQIDKIAKDNAARKAASLKHEAGGVLGEVRRKLQDARKLQELIKSLTKLRELRECEREKKGVHPSSSSSEGWNFLNKCGYVEKMVGERIRNYEDEEKALRVIIMEEEGERKKKEKQERMEQKALLNLSEGLNRLSECTAEYNERLVDIPSILKADPVADFRRYYAQADESLPNLIQIRREWDSFLAVDTSAASRIPDEDVTAVPPTSSLWASVLVNKE